MAEQEFSRLAQMVLAELATRCDLSVHDAESVHQHSNLAIALPSAGLLIRISGRTNRLAGITASVQVTRWLAGKGYPCITPADISPFEVDGHSVSVWHLLEVAEGPPGTGAELGRLLRMLHAQPEPPFDVPYLDDPLAGVAAALDQHGHCLPDSDHTWLERRIHQLRELWNELVPALPVGLIHGDAHTNNLIRTKQGRVLLGDWDHVALGPREWDLIQPHYMRRRFSRHTAQDIDEFTAEYGWDVRDWGGYQDLVELREISGLSPYIRQAPSRPWSRSEVAHRVATLRQRNTAATWNSPPRMS